MCFSVSFVIQPSILGILIADTKPEVVHFQFSQYDTNI